MERSIVVPTGLGLRLLFVVLALVGALDGFVCLQFPQEQVLGTVERSPGDGRGYMLLAAALADDDDHHHLALGPSGKAVPASALTLVDRAAMPAAGDAVAAEPIQVACDVPALGPRGPPQVL